MSPYQSLQSSLRAQKIYNTIHIFLQETRADSFFFKEQLKNFQIKMPPAATLRNDNSKINTATIYLASNSLLAIKDKSKLPHNHLFKEPIKQSKSDVSSTVETKLLEISYCKKTSQSCKGRVSRTVRIKVNKPKKGKIQLLVCYQCCVLIG